MTSLPGDPVGLGGVPLILLVWAVFLLLLLPLCGPFLWNDLPTGESCFQFLWRPFPRRAFPCWCCLPACASESKWYGLPTAYEFTWLEIIRPLISPESLFLFCPQELVVWEADWVSVPLTTPLFPSPPSQTVAG